MGKNGKKSPVNNPWENAKPLTEGKPKAASLVPRADRQGLPFLTFSFRYCTQQEYFGIAGQDAAWFANLQDRLKDLSGKTGAIVESKKDRADYRLHPIDWGKAPIRKDDLKSVPKCLIDGAEDDFFWQFQLSKGTGRVIGFFSADMAVFYIVLLDPKHNMQPSKDYGFRVDETEIALTEYERIQMLVAGWEDLRCKCKHLTDCPLTALQKEYIRSDVFFACLDEELKDEFRDLMEKGVFQKKLNEFLLKGWMDSNE